MKKIVKLALTAAAVLIAVVGLVACSSGSKKSDFSESGKEKVFYLSYQVFFKELEIVSLTFGKMVMV